MNGNHGLDFPSDDSWAAVDVPPDEINRAEGGTITQGHSSTANGEIPPYPSLGMYHSHLYSVLFQIMGWMVLLLLPTVRNQRRRGVSRHSIWPVKIPTSC